MVDRPGLSMRASHVLVAVFVIAALIFAAIGAAMGDTFFWRLATEALIFAGLALSVDILLGYTGSVAWSGFSISNGSLHLRIVLKEVPSLDCNGRRSGCGLDCRHDRRPDRQPCARCLLRARYFRSLRKLPHVLSTTPDHLARLTGWPICV
jgi:hypothetical protein